MVLVVFAGVRQRDTSSPDTKPFISVVVAMRNEASNVDSLLESLLNQSYADYEVILVDDHSTDDTLSVVRRYTGDRSLRVMVSAGEGKKHAITSGIAAARGTWIVTTDADCRHHPSWLEALASAMGENVNMVCAPVVISDSGSVWGKLQQTEFFSVMALTIASFYWRKPVMCNGANLAYRKSIFEKVGGFSGNEGVPSGDDEFMMRKVLRAHPASVHCITGSPAVVHTALLPDLATFLRQRIRWASKWRFSGDATSQAAAIFIFLVQCAVLTSFVMVALNPLSWVTILLGLKAIAEGFLLRHAARTLHTKFHLLSFLALQVIYPVYVVAVAILSNVRGYIWKDRFYLSKTHV